MLIEKAYFNGSPVPLHGDTVKTGTKGIEEINIRFTATSFLSPGKMKFKYRLEGHDGQWLSSPGDGKREAVYRNLEPGTYTFRVIAGSAAGAWNRTGAALVFTLEPYVFQRLWFRLMLLFLAVVTAAAGIYFFAAYKKRAGGRKGKYRSSSLTPRMAESYITRLKYLMEEEKIYRDAELSLPALAEKLSISSHVLSQLLNERLDRNFSDFVNSYRVEEAKEILRGPRGGRVKIAVVAGDVGFNTMVSFYNAFKKHTGMPPARYRETAGRE